MITVQEYFMGRDKQYAAQLTSEYQKNAEETCRRVNLLLGRAARDGVYPAKDQVTKTPVASGWRPPAVNDRTANAAKASTHLTCEGCDLQDHLDRRLAAWCIANLDVLEEIGLWMEDPRWTYRTSMDRTPDPWVHVQTRPPRSGRRVFIPSTKPPLGSLLPGQT